MGIDFSAEGFVAGVGVGELRPAAFATQLIGDLVTGDRKKIRLKFAAIVEVRQAGQKSDKGLLNHVLAQVSVVQPMADECQQASLETGDELFPGLGVAR